MLNTVKTRLRLRHQLLYPEPKPKLKTFSLSMASAKTNFLIIACTFFAINMAISNPIPTTPKVRTWLDDIKDEVREEIRQEMKAEKQNQKNAMLDVLAVLGLIFRNPIPIADTVSEKQGK